DDASDEDYLEAERSAAPTRRLPPRKKKEEPPPQEESETVSEPRGRHFVEHVEEKQFDLKAMVLAGLLVVGVLALVCAGGMFVMNMLARPSHTGDQEANCGPRAAPGPRPLRPPRPATTSGITGVPGSAPVTPAAGTTSSITPRPGGPIFTPVVPPGGSVSKP